jgi:hypothetical protein
MLWARLNALAGWQLRLGHSYWHADHVACNPFEAFASDSWISYCSKWHAVG